MWKGVPVSCLDAQPLEQASTLVAHCYLSEDIYQWEMRELLPSHWQFVGHASELSEPGQFRPLEVLGRPVLLVNDQGKLRAFHNVCRHRAGPLASCPGRGSYLRCQYHGWVYALDGRLKAAPRFEGVEDFDVAEVRLPSLPLQVVNGLIFVALTSCISDLDEIFSLITKRSETFLKSSMILMQRRVYPVACNWKLYIDNFLESYHVPLVHPSFDGVLDSREVAIECHGTASLQTAPITNAKGKYGEGTGEAHYWFVFPNLMLNLVPGRIQSNRVVPRGVDHCEVIFEWYAEAGSEAQLERDVAFSSDVQEEDRRICEAVHKGIAGGSWQSGRLSVSQEPAVHHFHERMRQAYLQAYRQATGENQLQSGAKSASQAGT